MRWTDISSDPNSPEAISYRAKQVSRAAAMFPTTRNDLVANLVRGKAVLDIGCVDHDFDLADKSTWLHGIIARSARYVLGVDYDDAGIQKMRDAGYNVTQVDITRDMAAVAKEGPFDIIVAGEIIEHVRSPQAVLDLAPHLLTPQGQMLITTPNPYALWRVRNGQHGRSFENVDHVVYCFPAGIAEMADRAGMTLVQYGSVDDTRRKSLRRMTRVWLGAKRRRIRLGPWWPSLLDLIVMRVRGGFMLGETAVYLLEVQKEQEPMWNLGNSFPV